MYTARLGEQREIRVVDRRRFLRRLSRPIIII